MFDLKRFRKVKNLKQAEVADNARLDQSRISRYERGIKSDQVEERLLKAYPELESYVLPDAEKNELAKAQEEAEFWKDKYEDAFEMTSELLKETRRQREEMDKLLAALKAIKDKMDEQK